MLYKKLYKQLLKKYTLRLLLFQKITKTTRLT